MDGGVINGSSSVCMIKFKSNDASIMLLLLKAVNICELIWCIFMQFYVKKVSAPTNSPNNIIKI